VDWTKRRGSVSAVLALLWTLSTAVEARAQADGAHRAYFRGVAEYFQLPEAEVSILGDWNLPADEIPVALFIASRAGISPEALVALRGSGRSWVELSRRYQVGPAQLHVPLTAPLPSGYLSLAYQQYQSRPVGEWGQIELTDEDIVVLVNVRVLSTILSVRPEEILRRRAGARSFVDVYARLIG